MKIRARDFTNEFATKLDESPAGTTYVGKTPVGSATSTPSWQIMKMVETSTTLTITWADGDSAFDNIWDDRASLTYS
jgi:hypothetical protein